MDSCERKAISARMHATFFSILFVVLLAISTILYDQTLLVPMFVLFAFGFGARAGACFQKAEMLDGNF